MRQEQPDRAADPDENQGLDDELTCESQPAATEGGAHGQLLLARGRPRGEQVGEVQAGHHEYQAGHHPHRQERPPHVLHQQLPDERQANRPGVTSSWREGGQLGLDPGRRPFGRETAKDFEVVVQAVALRAGRGRAIGSSRSDFGKRSKAAGNTPATVAGAASRVTVRPTMAGSDPKRRSRVHD